MPYRTDAELPDSVKDNLPAHAQVAHKVAWAAVKHKYEKVDNDWRAKG
jgi:cation transport regulator ChaB